MEPSAAYPSRSLIPRHSTGGDADHGVPASVGRTLADVTSIVRQFNRAARHLGDATDATILNLHW
jgi:hypothetical protein